MDGQVLIISTGTMEVEGRGGEGRPGRGTPVYKIMRGKDKGYHQIHFLRVEMSRTRGFSFKVRVVKFKEYIRDKFFLH